MEVVQDRDGVRDIDLLVPVRIAAEERQRDAERSARCMGGAPCVRDREADFPGALGEFVLQARSLEDPAIQSPLIPGDPGVLPRDARRAVERHAAAWLAAFRMHVERCEGKPEDPFQHTEFPAVLGILGREEDPVAYEERVRRSRPVNPRPDVGNERGRQPRRPEPHDPEFSAVLGVGGGEEEALARAREEPRLRPLTRRVEVFYQAGFLRPEDGREGRGGPDRYVARVTGRSGGRRPGRPAVEPPAGGRGWQGG